MFKLMAKASTQQGSLVCVGVGMTLGAHICPLARSYLEQADVVFVAVSDGLVEQWVKGMNEDVRSLQSYYKEGCNRHDSYKGMVEAMLAEVRAGKKVCGAFYGHPAVFALPPRRAVEIARSEGYSAHIEAGISAADCLYADLGLDPGQYGCQHFEASQFMFYQRRIDPSASLILWQAGLAGDQSLTRFQTGTAYRQVLVDLLAVDYPLDHPVVIYRAPTLPIHRARIEHSTLRQLPEAEIDMHDTLVLEPAMAMRPNRRARKLLDALDSGGHTDQVPVSQAAGTTNDKKPAIQ